MTASALPVSSTTRSVTGHVPATNGSTVAIGPSVTRSKAPSDCKSQPNSTISPSGSYEELASNRTRSPARRGRARSVPASETGPHVNEATGVVCASRITTDCTRVAVSPSSSATVSATVYSPGVTKLWETGLPRSTAPSPKSHQYSTTAPSGSIVSVASKTTGSPASGSYGAYPKAGTGGVFGRGMNHRPVSRSTARRNRTPSAVSTPTSDSIETSARRSAARRATSATVRSAISTSMSIRESRATSDHVRARLPEVGASK